MSIPSFRYSKYLQKIDQALTNVELIQSYGKVTDVSGQTIISDGPKEVKIGEQVQIEIEDNSERSSLTTKDRANVARNFLYGEVVGFQNHRIIIMPLGNAQGIQSGARVLPGKGKFGMPVCQDLIGRVLNGLGEPLDNLGPLTANAKFHSGNISEQPQQTQKKLPMMDRRSDVSVAVPQQNWISIDGDPPLPTERPTIKKQMMTGIRAIDGLLSIGRGQRVGIFAGTGVGKSTLLGMIARYTESDINVICLVGERGREVRDFIESDLGADGMKRSIVFATTGDRPAMEKIYCAGFATSVAEYFRDQGRHVNFYMDSVTRYAMALREVSIAAGEPLGPSGYPPSVWYKLSRLVERTGNSPEGSITAFYAVLVEADDMNDPVADNVRGVLDGHITLSRRLSQKNHFPAIEVGESISRVMNSIISSEQIQLANHMRHLLSVYKENEEIISLGAYVRNSNPLIDEAIEKKDLLEEFLRQDLLAKGNPADTLNMMQIIVQGLPETPDEYATTDIGTSDV